MSLSQCHPTPTPTPTVKQISECFIKPKKFLEAAKQPVYFSPWELSLMSLDYNQKGILFAKPPPPSEQENQGSSSMNIITCFLENLKDSLSSTLTNFYPLAARLATHKQDNPPSYFIFIDASVNGPGAKFIHASADLNISDILSPTYIPVIVHSFFPYNEAINHDGHTLPLLTVQVTELIDGVFIGCTMNHSVADGTSFWHFMNTWNEIFEAKGQMSYSISHPPIHRQNNWLPVGYPHQYDPIINLPFTHPHQFITRMLENPPPIREKIFHFSLHSLSNLKAKANSELDTNKISTFLALAAHTWRCVTRARKIPHDQRTSCSIVVNYRTRLDPPLSEDFLGNPVGTVSGTATAGELLEKGLGWAASVLREAVASRTNKQVHEWLEEWFKSPSVLKPLYGPNMIHFGSSPRFGMNGNGFGLGKPVAILSGKANKFDGKLNTFPGVGKGSIDLEVCLSPETMVALGSDLEFIDALFI